MEFPAYLTSLFCNFIWRTVDFMWLAWNERIFAKMAQGWILQQLFLLLNIDEIPKQFDTCIFVEDAATCNLLWSKLSFHIDCKPAWMRTRNSARNERWNATKTDRIFFRQTKKRKEQRLSLGLSRTGGKINGQVSWNRPWK